MEIEFRILSHTIPSVIPYLSLFLVTFRFLRTGNTFQMNGPPSWKRRTATVSRSPRVEYCIITVINAFLCTYITANVFFFFSFDRSSNYRDSCPFAYVRPTIFDEKNYRVKDNRVEIIYIVSYLVDNNAQTENGNLS